MRFFRPLVRILLLCIGLVFLISCGRDISRQSLADIESILDSRPDSALILLRQVDTTALRGRAAKASFALLHAAALDKNYIDTADTRIVQPAVDWYDRHGTPEQRLKAWMYLGTEQLNGEDYGEAIVSFYEALESVPKVGDNNLIGILYSKIADTYTVTLDYAQASSFIDKSIESFKSCGRSDQESIELLRKATNLSQRRLWDEANISFNELLSRKSIDTWIKRKAEIEYGMFLLNRPDPDEVQAERIISSAINEGGSLESPPQIYAYAYLLKSQGKAKESDTILRLIQQYPNKDEYSYHYWNYRWHLKSGDKGAAHSSLWAAMSAMDSIRRKSYEHSAANSQRSFLESTSTERALRIENQKRKAMITYLLCLVLALILLALYLLYINVLKRRRADEERLSLVIDNLKNQIDYLKKSGKHKASLTFLGEIYEEAYRGGGDAAENLTKVIKRRIGDLKSDPAAQREFEGMVDSKMNGIMKKFRSDCPGLSESDYRMSSYYFAGFDNTTVMIIMGVSSLTNMRSRKRYLKRKLVSKYGEVGQRYAYLFES